MSRIFIADSNCLISIIYRHGPEMKHTQDRKIHDESCEKGGGGMLSESVPHKMVIIDIPPILRGNVAFSRPSSWTLNHPQPFTTGVCPACSERGN